MKSDRVSRASLRRQLLDLGVELGGVLLVHTAFSKAGSDGNLVQYRHAEIDHCCGDFGLVHRWLDDEHLWHRGCVGYDEARPARSRDIVRLVVDLLRQNETVLLQPLGVDQQCDEARRSLVEAEAA